MPKTITVYEVHNTRGLLKTFDSRTDALELQQKLVLQSPRAARKNPIAWIQQSTITVEK